MKLSVPSATLRELAEFAHRTAPAKPTIPILSCVVLDATADGQLVARVTDYETWGRAERKANVITAGSAAVSARLLKAIADIMPDGTIELILDGQVLRLIGGKSKASAPILPPEDFPASPNPTMGHRYAVEGPALARALDVCQDVSANAGGARALPELAKAALYCTPDGLRIEATDGHRAYDLRTPWLEPPTAEAVADPRAAAFLAHISLGPVIALAKAEPRLLIEMPPADTLGTGLARFGGVSVQLLTRLNASDKWPDVPGYLRQISKNARSYTVDAAWLLTALRAAAGFVDNNGAVRVTVTPDELGVDASAGDAGSFDRAGGAVEVDPGWADEIPEPFVQGFNPRYLSDAILAVGTPQITLHVGEPIKPVLLTPTHADDDASASTGPANTAVVMPVRLN